MLYIITPVSRPDNLLKIAKTIPEEVMWCIVYDADTKENPVIDEEYADFIYRAETKSHWGNTCRDYALNHLPLKDGDWIYYLDDDNYFHPELLNIELDDSAAVIGFLQMYKKSIRFAEVKYTNCHIDGGACLFNWRLVKNVRWTSNAHNHDYLYIRDCLKNGPSKTVNVCASYYNAIEWM